MITTRRLRAPLVLEASEIRQAIGALASSGWLPAILESERSFLKLAGLEGGDPSWLRRPLVRQRPRATTGDVFFRDDGLYYLFSSSDRVILTENEFGLEERIGDPFLEVGGVGEDEAALDAGLAELTGALETALRSGLDGRRVRYMKFDWETPAPSTTRLSALRMSELEDGDATSFEPAVLDDDLVAATEILADPLTREGLREISRAGFARERDIASRWARRERGEELVRAVLRARDAGLLATEYLLECRATGDQILRLASPDDLDAGGHGGLKHASCGKAFRDELLSEGYSLTELGQRLVQKSNWMTVWVTERLRRVGIPLEGVLWNLSESGEEVDILLEFLEEVWIIELKDRTFSAGDAYPFNYRRARYGADKAFVITTEQVATDAKRVFEELTAQVRRSAGAAQQPFYIEGLDAVEKELHAHVARTAANFAARQLQPLSAATGFDLRRVVEERTTRAAADASPPRVSRRPAGAPREIAAVEVNGG